MARTIELPQRPSPSEPVTEAALEPLPKAVRDKLRKQMARGEVRTMGDLFERLTPKQASAVRTALVLAMPELADLCASMANELLASVGLPRDYLLGWYPVSAALQYPVVSQDTREHLLTALAQRARWRAAARQAEQERHEARYTRPEEVLVPLWTELCAAREQLRQQVVPEGEADVLTAWKLDEREGRVELAGNGAVVWVRVLDGLAVETSAGPRWGLGAVDHLLDVLADPTSDLRRALAQLLSQPTWPRALARLDAMLEQVVPAEALLGWRVQTDSWGRLTIRPVSCTPRPKGGGRPSRCGGAISPLR